MKPTIRIAGTGSYLPERAVTSAELAVKVHVEESWIEERTGIHTRHFAAQGESNADMAVAAAQAALKASGYAAKDIDAVIATTLSPDRYFPGISADVQARLKCGRVPAFDISCQCNGFTFGLSVAAGYILSGQYKRILLVSSEIHSRTLRFAHDNKDLCVLFGDGAGAVVIEKSTARAHDRLAFELHTDGHFAGDLAFHRDAKPGRPAQPVMNKTSVIVHSSRSVAEVVQSILRKNGIDMDGIDCVVPHQSNLKLIEEISRRLDCPLSKFIINIDRVGNTSSASIPIALDHAVRSGRIRRGDQLLLVSFGAGFSWGACLLTY